VTSAYRDDLGAAEERLARFEASHVERELSRLRTLRASAASTQPLASTEVATRLAFCVPALSAALNFQSAYRNGPLGVATVLFLLCAVFAVWFLGATSARYITRKRRRKQAEELATIDARITALENAPRRIEIATLEQVRVRIAELEAEEASAAGDAARRVGSDDA
jgi:cell division protein FtsB